LSQLRSLQMADALRDLRGEEQGQHDAAMSEARFVDAATEDVVRLEDRRASSPFLKELSLDAKKSLTQILGITQILKYKKDAKDQAQLVKQLTAYARRLDLTVSDLADADKLARGSVELTVRRTDLEALVQRVISESDVSADHDLRVVTEPLVCGVDQLRTEQVLAGLLRSSADRTPQGKSILVTLQHVQGGALICVGDPEPSSEASLSPVVKRFAEIQGGWAKVGTREDGTGSLFRVFLPDGGINGEAAEGATFQPGADLHIVVDEAGGADPDEGPWDDADQDMLVREIGRLAEPS
jgi:K+-sensing histidine kinase KdpD